jgi:hypothetical protein
LTLLAVAFVVVVGRQLLPLAGGLRGSGTRSSAGSRTGSDLTGWSATLPRVEELQLGDLEVATEDLSEGRNPFQRRRSPPPPRPQPAESDIRQRIEEARQRQEDKEPEPVRPAAPRPPTVDVVYLGSFGSGRMRLAVFSDGSEIFNVPEGDVLKEKFVVVKIGLESADLGFVGFPDAPAKRLEIGG